MPLLKAPTRSYVQSTAFERAVGCAAATPFIVIYFVAPLYLLFALAALLLAPFSPYTWLALVPMAASLLLPASVPRALSPHILGSWACRKIPKYFSYEEYHELSDTELVASNAAGKSYILVAHPHGVFSYTGVRRMTPRDPVRSIP